MGELQHEAFQFAFNGFLKVAFQGSRVTSDAGLLLVRELDERLGLEALISEYLNDSRQGLNTQFSLADLLRQSVYSRLAGYEDLNDAVRVSADPTFRLIRCRNAGTGVRRWTLHWFETELLTHEENLVGLRAVNRDACTGRDGDARRPDRARHRAPIHRKGRIHGHFESVCYHPLSVQRPGRLPGRLAAARTCRAPTTGTTSSCRPTARRVAFRADAAFARPATEALEQRDVDYAIRMPEQDVGVGGRRHPLSSAWTRPSCKPLVRYKSFRPGVDHPRIVAKVEHHRGELFPRVRWSFRSSGSTTSAARRSNGSRKASSHPLDAAVVIGSGQTRCACD